MIISIQGIITATVPYYATLLPSPQTLILKYSDVPITTPFPLSSLQLFQFLLSTFPPASSSYTVPDTLQLDSATQPKLVCTKVVL